MSPSTLQGAAFLVLAVVLAVWVYLLKTNIIRWYRLPLAAIAFVAGYTLVCLNAKIVSTSRLSAEVITWWENTALTVVTVLVFVLPAMHMLHERHAKRTVRAMKRPHARARAHR